MSLPEDYLQLLEELAIAFAAYERLTGHTPVLVGGGAVAIQTQGSFMSGDLDLYASNDEALDQCLLEAGFLADERVGRLRGGYYHPRFERYGIESISGQLFDGLVERDRLIRISLDGDKGIIIPSFEDMIADRLGQYAGGRKSDDSRLQQARLLFKLAENLDLDYLKRRIGEEGGDYQLLNQSLRIRKGGE